MTIIALVFGTLLGLWVIRALRTGRLLLFVRPKDVTIRRRGNSTIFWIAIAIGPGASAILLVIGLWQLAAIIVVLFWT
jgi:hypothetical protein